MAQICARDFFYPQIPQISADYGGLSCRCAAIHAAGFKALFLPYAKAIYSHAKARRREEDKGREEWRLVLPLRGNSRRRFDLAVCTLAKKSAKVVI